MFYANILVALNKLTCAILYCIVFENSVIIQSILKKSSLFAHVSFTKSYCVTGRNC